MAEQKDTGPDRGALDLRGLFFLFIGLVGALALYAKDDDGTRATIWFILFVGGGIALIARAFKQEKLAGLILPISSIAAAILIYQADSDNLVGAVILALVGLAAGAYLILFASTKA
jgi:membrane-bound metal-dependent hydrolase YbcI (DUF457 family)